MRSKRIKLAEKKGDQEQQESLEFELRVKGAEDDHAEDEYIRRFHTDVSQSRIAEWRSSPAAAAAAAAVLAPSAVLSPLLINSNCSSFSATIANANVKQRLADHWMQVRNTIAANNDNDDDDDDGGGSGGELNEFERVYWSMLNTYSDIFDVSAPPPSDKRALARLYAAHIVNHVLKHRDRVIKGNLKLKRSQGACEVRDRGFCRATVLVLLPMRNMVLDFVQDLLMHYPNLERVDGRDTLINEFSANDEDPMDYSRKPEDFQRTFRGNVDDSFRVGIKMSRKRVKLYADFYKSDVVVASPLGLRTLYDEQENSKNQGTYDFLSTIQVVIIDGTETMMMQNWSHLEFVLEQLNQVPTLPRDTDFSRLQNVYAQGAGAFLRQTCCFSEVETPELRALFSSACHNHLRSLIRRTQPGCTASVRATTKQLFHRFDNNSPVDDADKRFDFFVERVLPELLQGGRTGLLIYVPSYFDFVRLRNYIANEYLSCEMISEYSTQSEQTRSRAMFANGKVSFLLYTERFHFYKRYAIKGVSSVLFYQPPLFPRFYQEILGSITADVVDAVGIVLYSSLDRLALQRIVGSKRANKMIKSKSSSTHVIC